MKILHLTLKKKWFDMILSGEKKEEYREMKYYWSNRFYKPAGNKAGPNYITQYDRVVFKNGYSKDCPEMQVECNGIEIGPGNSSWGGGNTCFVIKLGKVLETKNLK